MLQRREKLRFSGKKKFSLYFRDAVAVRIRVFHLFKNVLTSCQQGDFVFVDRSEHLFPVTFGADCNGILKVFWFFEAKNNKLGS